MAEPKISPALPERTVSIPHSVPLSFLPPVIAHRGVRAHAPENTLSAFQLAADQGIGWVETDVKLSHDGVPILFHDDVLDHITNGHGAVADKNWDELRHVRVRGRDGVSTDTIPQLQDALRLVLDRGVRINLELKPCVGRTQATTMVSMIAAARLWPEECPPPLISSFDIEALAIASRLHPDWPRGLLLDDWRDDWRELAMLLRISSVHVAATCVTQERIDAVRGCGLPLLVYTVNEPLQAKRLLQQGVTAVFSDNPAEILKVL